MSRFLRIVLPALVILVWLVVAGVGGPVFGKISEVATNDQTSFLPASAEPTPRLSRMLGVVGSVLATVPNEVVVVGGHGFGEFVSGSLMGRKVGIPLWQR